MFLECWTESKISFLKRAAEINRIIVLTDNDEAGYQIENKLKNNINGVFALKSEKITKKNAKKSGVAETTKEEILRVLNPHFSSKNTQKSRNSLVNLSKLDLTSKELRSYLSRKYHLGKCNLKKLLVRLETLEITVEELEQSIKEFYGN